MRKLQGRTGMSVQTLSLSTVEEGGKTVSEGLRSGAARRQAGETHDE